MTPGPFTVGHLGGEEFGLPVLLAAMGVGVAWAIRRMRGGTAARSEADQSRRDRERNAWLGGGILALAVALSDPMDRYSAQLFWVHMVQHVVLLTVAAPLIALGAPWRFAPRRIASWWSARFDTGASRSAIARSAVAVWLVFNGAFLAFHVPVLYDAAVAHLWVHVIEHGVFVVTAVWFWAVVFDPAAFGTAQGDLWRIGYLITAAVVGWMLAIVLTFAPDPLYQEYARLLGRPGRISALADQQLAAGVMLVPGSITFLLVAGILVARWIGQETVTPESHRSNRGEVVSR
jgi:cytochrome c oxidase assembly factor CtaG